MSRKEKPLCFMDAFKSGTNWFLSPEKLLATKLAPSWIAIAAKSIGGKRLSSPYLLFDSRSFVAENCPLVSP